MEKTYISANDLLIDSFRLAQKIFKSGLRPDIIIGVWRGGTPVAIAVHEYFTYMGHECDHYPVRAHSYTGIDQRKEIVEVAGIDYLESRYEKINQVLIVDDVFDTGNSLKTMNDLILSIKAGFDIKIATPWYKPDNNLTDITPDYFIHETDNWLVFPHELTGLSKEEIQEQKSEVIKLLN